MNDQASPADASSRLLNNRHKEMIAAYGFGLPIPLPDLHETRCGEWSVSTRSGGTWPGYLIKREPTPDHHVLRQDRTAWAASGVRDLESFAWHLHKATGTVIVVGTGLGTFTHALAAKSTVERIMAVDPDADALLTLKVAAIPHDWPGAEKITFVHTDPFSSAGRDKILSLLDDSRPDYLFVDLWPLPCDAEAAEDTRDLAQSLRPHCAGWRGQEVEAARWLEQKSLPVETRLIDSYFSSVGVPMRATEDYVEFCVDVGRANGFNISADAMAFS